PYSATLDGTPAKKAGAERSSACNAERSALAESTGAAVNIAAYRDPWARSPCHEKITRRIRHEPPASGGIDHAGGILALERRVLALRSGILALRSRVLALRHRDLALRSHDLALRSRDSALRSRDLALRSRDSALRGRDLVL